LAANNIKLIDRIPNSTVGNCEGNSHNSPTKFTMAAWQREQFERLCLQVRKGELKAVFVTNLRYGTLTEEMLKDLLGCSSSIQTLHLNIHLSKAMLLTLAAWLATDNSVTYLGLEYCDASFIDFLKAVRQVHVETLQLGFSKNMVLDHEAQNVVQDFFANGAFKNLRFGVYEELGVWEARQQGSLLECLLIGLANNTTLLALDLQLVKGVDLSVDSLENFFQQNEKLQRFSVMAYDEISESFVSDLLTALMSSGVPRDIGLKSLSQEASVALFRHLASATTISSLSTTQFEYRPQDLEILSQSLSSNATIRKLSLTAPNGRAHTTLAALVPVLSKHSVLESFQIHGHDITSTDNILPIVEVILERNPRLREFGFPIYTATDAKDLLGLIPRLNNLRSLRIEDGSSSVPLLDPDNLLDALDQNLTLISYDFFSPKNEHHVRLQRILQRNVQMMRRIEMTKSIQQLATSPQLWPLIQYEMSNHDGWIDARYYFIRELVMLHPP
jgi:hypothetical protein